MPARSSSRRPRLRFKAVVWLAVALAPTLLSIGLPAAILWRTGEIGNPNLEEGPMLAGFAYRGGGPRFHVLTQEKWDVVAVGTSRAMQFRDRFFRKDARFFCAGQAISNIEGLLPFIETAPPEMLPRVLIVVLDQYFFNDHWASDHRGWSTAPGRAETLFESWARNLDVLERNWRVVLRETLGGRITLENVTRDHHGKIQLIGLTARTYLGGTRRDGSYRYGRRIGWPDDPELEDYQFLDTFERIDKGRRRFEYGSEVSQRSLELLNQFLARADELGVEVIGLLPSYANVAWDRMMSMGDKYEYMRKLPAVAGEVFERHEMKLYDFSALRDVGATDEEALDGFHASEKAIARALVIMARDHPKLRKYVDPEELERAILSSPEPLEVFPPEP